jgi:hypothetical protein
MKCKQTSNGRPWRSDPCAHSCCLASASKVPSRPPSPSPPSASASARLFFSPQSPSAERLGSAYYLGRAACAFSLCSGRTKLLCAGRPSSQAEHAAHVMSTRRTTRETHRECRDHARTGQEEEERPVGRQPDRRWRGERTRGEDGRGLCRCGQTTAPRTARAPLPPMAGEPI